MHRLMLIGAPRSGTTWLSKLIDANPSVQYIHEPDSVIHDARVPPVFHDTTPSDELLASVRQYTESIYKVFTLKT